MIGGRLDKIARRFFYCAACVIVLLLFYRAGSACQVNEVYLTKEGSLAATTAEKLSEANGYHDKADQGKLSSMMKTGTVIRLKEDVKVRVTERSVEYRMLKISLPDREIPFWVNDGALKPMKCEHDEN